MVEAAGIEPASEINLPIAPTCFLPDLNLVSEVAQGIGYSANQPGYLGPASQTTGRAQPQSMPIRPMLRYPPGRSRRLVFN